MGIPQRDLLTIHLNDYFQCGAANAVVPRQYWGRFHSRIERNTLRLLDELDERHCEATFFSSGWTADHVPELLAEIVRRGHEIASSGYYQSRVSRLSHDDFRQEVVRSRVALERACGQEVVGYRCAGWLRPSDAWALEILAEEGVRYDSSFYQFGYRLGAARTAAPRTFTFGDRSIWEVPIPYGRVAAFRFPISGGTYLRQLPFGYMLKQVERWHARSQGPWLLYFQVTELDPDQPRLATLPWFRAVQKYRNIAQMHERVFQCLERYSFCSIRTHLELPERAVSSRPEPASGGSPGIHAARGEPCRPITVVVPCYREEDTIPYLANTLRAFEENHRDEFAISYVLVDDGSTDRTFERLVEFFGHRPSVQIVHHPRNLGVTAAMLTGIRHAPTETVCVIDSDCSYSPETLVPMVRELRDGVVLVTASPYHRDGSVINVPGWRLFLSRGLSFLYQRVLTTRLATYTSCCRVYSRSAIVDLDIVHGDFRGVTEIIVRLDERGRKVVEVPAVLESRMLGASKMKTFRTIVAHARCLWSIVVERALRRLDSGAAGKQHPAQ